MNNFNIPKITLDTEKEMSEISKKWWDNTHENISVLSWNDTLKNASVPYTLIDLNRDFIEMVLSEGRTPIETQVKEFNKLLSEQGLIPIKNKFFGKTITRSSKDVTPDLKFNSVEEFLMSIGSSLRTFEDLCLLSRIPQKAKLIIKEFIDVDKSKEFRVFIKDNKLNGITQYHWSEKYSWILENTKNIESVIRRFVKETILPNVVADSYVLDIMVGYDENGLMYCTLTEINPYGLSDPCIYESYGKLKDNFVYMVE